MDFATLLDAPIELADAAAPVTEHPIAKLGSYKDARYGSFSITRADFEAWQRKLKANQNGRIPIDYDHAAAKPGGSTEAAGWVTDIRLDGSLVVGRIEWTPEGAQAVRDKRYLYVSPEFTEHYKDESGKDTGKALLGVALTNRPFLRKGMPAISLSAHSFAEPEATVNITAPTTYTTSSSTTGYVTASAGDSPTRMPELSNIAKALGLAEDADEQAIVDAISEAREPEPVKLDEAAAAEGKVLLDQGTVTELRTKAEAGEKALAQLTEQRFTDAFDKALSEGRMDAREETRAAYKELYDAAPDATLKTLAAAPKIVRTEATDADSGPALDAEFSGSNVDTDRAEIDAKARKLAAEKDIDYIAAVEQVMGVAA